MMDCTFPHCNCVENDSPCAALKSGLVRRKAFEPDLAQDYPIKPLRGSPLEEEYLADIANGPDPADPSGERRTKAVRRLIEIDEERR